MSAPNRAASSDLGSRVVVAALGIPVVLGALYLGGWALGVMAAAAAAVAALEFYRLSEARGQRPFAAAGAAASGAVVLLAVGTPSPAAFGGAFLGVLLALALATLGGAVWLRWPGGDPLAAWSVTLTGVVYTGATFAFVPLLRGLAPAAGAPVGERLAGMGFVLLPLLATWAGDSAAYFAGRAWGRTRLAPAVSPGKTVAGAVAGLVGSTVAAAVVAAGLLGPVGTPGLGVAAAAGLGLVVGAAGQVGDLAESMLKREAGVKDSGRILAGHGGMLDRVDSLLFAFPATWGLLYLLGVLA